jgi:hypothetical protein
MKNPYPDVKMVYRPPSFELVQNFTQITGVSLPIGTNALDNFELENLTQEVLE